MLSNQDNYKLLIELEDWSDKKVYAEYSSFRLEPESEFYRLRLGTYQGNAGDSMMWHNGKQFTTLDRDKDMYAGEYKKNWCVFFMESPPSMHSIEPFLMKYYATKNLCRKVILDSDRGKRTIPKGTSFRISSIRNPKVWTLWRTMFCCSNLGVWGWKPLNYNNRNKTLKCLKIITSTNWTPTMCQALLWVWGCSCEQSSCPLEFTLQKETKGFIR